MVNEIELAPGIIVYKNTIPETEKWLSILKTYSEVTLHYGRVVRYNGSNHYSDVDLNHRKCQIFSDESLASCHYEDPLRVLSTEVENFMNQNIEKFVIKYRMNQVKKNHSVIFLKYEKGDFFNEHNDDSFSHPRTISTLVYFNKDYSGGEICFKYFDIDYKPDDGDCLVFSSAFPYKHSVKPISEGVRYAAVNWYKYI